MINHKDITYKVLLEPCQEIINLLSNTIYGTKGLRYGHQNVKKRVYYLEKPHFHTLWLGNDLLAVAAYCQREILLNVNSLSCIYIRYFAVNDNYQGQGLGKLLTENLYRYYESSLTKETVFYAYIEQKNVRSMGVSKRFKQEQIGQFKTVYFSRFFPKTQRGVVQLSNTEAIELLQENKSTKALFGTYKLGYENGYYALKQNNEIVAGIQANKITWTIHNLPGLMGWLTRNVLHFSPVVGRLSPRNTFSFLTFEGVYLKENHEQDLLRLMEHCLSIYNVNSGILPLDVEDDLFKKLNCQSNLGLMHKIQPAPPVSILVNFFNVNKETEENLKQLPKYISGFDIS